MRDRIVIELVDRSDQPMPEARKAEVMDMIYEAVESAATGSPYA